MKMNKIVVATALGAVFAINVMGSAFAADVSTTTPNQQSTKKVVPKQDSGNKDGFRGGANLEKQAAEKGITVDALKAQMEQERQAQLEKLAAEKGITVDELKAQMDQERQTQLEKLAAEKGIAVDELKAQMEQERGNKGGFPGRNGANLEKQAAEKGITVDALKAQMDQERQAQLEKLAAEKGITVDELKAQMEQEHGNHDQRPAN